MLYNVPSVGTKLYLITIDENNLQVVQECRVHRVNKDTEPLLTPRHLAFHKDGNLRPDSEISVKYAEHSPRPFLTVTGVGAEKCEDLFLDRKNALVAAVGRCNQQILTRIGRVESLILDL